MNKKSMAIVALATLCLMVTMFSIIPVMSAPAYDSWLDVNDSGSIDVKDYQIIKNAIPSVGDPTKNVIIAGHANKLAYNVSEFLSVGEWYTSAPILVDGYSKVSVNIAVTNSQFNYLLLCQHEESPSFWFEVEYHIENDLMSFSKTYDVMDKYISVKIYNFGSLDSQLYIDIYLIP